MQEMEIHLLYHHLKEIQVELDWLPLLMMVVVEVGQVQQELLDQALVMVEQEQQIVFQEVQHHMQAVEEVEVMVVQVEQVE